MINNYDNQLAKLNNISNDELALKYTLCDFYIKSAYNCCVVDNYKYDYVDLCGLTSCLRRGVRFLDFEIYSIKDKPVIACSSVDNVYVIESYNYISLSDALKLINNQAFSTSYTPNPNDPLIINLRIKSKNKNTYDNIASIINEILNNRLLSPKYENLSKITLSNLVGKIILTVQDKYQLVKKTKLNEVSNLTSNIHDNLLKTYTAKQVKQDTNLIEFNRFNLTIATPELGDKPKNINSDIMEQVGGVQFTCMCFQHKDSYLDRYEKKFENNGGYAFRLKPKNQRYIPIYIDTSNMKCDKSTEIARKLQICPEGQNKCTILST